MRPSEEAVEFIASWEGLKLKAYPDPGTGGVPWTIGFGRTAGVKRGDICTPEQAMDWLREEVDAFGEHVLELVHVELNQSQLDALTSFAYNVGVGNLSKSTLLKLVNEGRFDEAGQQFVRWNRAAGRVMAGLTNRRNAEAQLFLAEV